VGKGALWRALPTLRPERALIESYNKQRTARKGLNFFTAIHSDPKEVSGLARSLFAARTAARRAALWSIDAGLRC
jgi:hypothetical protein